MRRMIVDTCLFSLITASTVAAGETVSLGPASVSIDLKGIGSCAVELGDSYELDHDHDRMSSDFQYIIYPAKITFDGSSNQVEIEVHKMSVAQSLDAPIPKGMLSGMEHCLEQADMMPRRAEVQMQPYTIDGHEGVLATTDSGDENPIYIAAFSPDQEDGSGSIVCIVGSSFPWETTKSIISSIKVQVV